MHVRYTCVCVCARTSASFCILICFYLFDLFLFYFYFIGYLVSLVTDINFVLQIFKKILFMLCWVCLCLHLCSNCTFFFLFFSLSFFLSCVMSNERHSLQMTIYRIWSGALKIRLLEGLCYL